MVRKRLNSVLTSVTLTFELWPCPFVWTSLLSLVITPENFMMIRWGEHSERGVTGGRTDGRTDRRTEPFIELLGRSYKCIEFRMDNSFYSKDGQRINDLSQLQRIAGLNEREQTLSQSLNKEIIVCFDRFRASRNAIEVLPQNSPYYFCCKCGIIFRNTCPFSWRVYDVVP